jgi:hypothetical protein
MILIFNYENNLIKFIPNKNIDLVQYAKENLLSGTKYKIFDDNSINLNIDELKLLFEDANIVP